MQRHFKLVLIVLVSSLIAQNGICDDFMRGVDISMQTRQEDDGVIYKEYGVPKDILVILKNHDINWIRIRIFVDPSGSPYYGVCQDLDYVTELAARVRLAGFKFLLDFHYSDTWADPGHQDMPAAWVGLSHSQLVTAVHDYTQDVIEHLRTHNAMPDMVQIGNEVIDGILWPDGRISVNGFSNLADLINAGIDGVEDGRGTETMPKIMIHIDRGGDWGDTQWFFDNLIANGVSFDVIGQSFYPEWHGTLSDLENCLDNTAARYSHDIIVVEIGDYYTGVIGASSETQKAFIEGVIQRVESTPGGKGKGLCYWEPTWVWTSNVAYRALFEPVPAWNNVEMLMAMEAFDLADPNAGPPSAPTGLVATAGDSTVSLNWDDNSEGDLDGYNVYRSTTSGSGYSQINISLAVDSNYTDNSVDNGTPYYYVVTAVDDSNNQSGYSNEVSTTPDYQTCQDVIDEGYRLVSDINGDCSVDMWDVGVIALYWLDTNCASRGDCENADLEPDGDVDAIDYSNFAIDWMQCNKPGDVNCTPNWSW